MTNSAKEPEPDIASYKELIKYVRSSDEDDRRLTLTRIPNLVLAYYDTKSDLIKQILLLIYNLNTEGELYENLTLSNGPLVVRQLLRLYSDTAQAEHKHEQVEALVKLVQHSNTSALLIELSNVLYHCLGSKQLSKEDNESIEEALDGIREKAAANMFPDALLMIHSIMAIKLRSCSDGNQLHVTPKHKMREEHKKTTLSGFNSCS